MLQQHMCNNLYRNRILAHLLVYLVLNTFFLITQPSLGYPNGYFFVSFCFYLIGGFLLQSKYQFYAPIHLSDTFRSLSLLALLQTLFYLILKVLSLYTIIDISPIYIWEITLRTVIPYNWQNNVPSLSLFISLFIHLLPITILWCSAFEIGVRLDYYFRHSTH